MRETGTETVPFRFPRALAWEVTRTCPLACRHCRAGAGARVFSGELSTDECRRVIDSLAPRGADDPPAPMVIWTGGEPMARADAVELVAHATARGVRSVMAPCGSLATADRLRAFRDAGVAACSFSLDGATDAAHDAFRGVAGAFEQAIEGIRNVRDLGGWKTTDGRRVRQGLVYRSQGLNENADYYLNSKETMELYKEGKLEELYGKDGKEIKERLDREGGKDDFDPNAPWMRKSLPRKDPKPPKARLDEPTKAYLLDTLGIRSDVDLRGPTETWGMTGSPLGPRATWFHISSEPYRGMGMQVGKEAFARVFRVFLDRKNYPIVFHCIGGADRTGCDAWILNGLLGVSEDDLLRDWELTCFEYESMDFGHDTRLVRLLKVLDDAGGATMREKCENYVKALGFTEVDLAAFRDIMLEDAAPFELSVRKVRLTLGATQPFTFLHFSDTHLAVPSTKNPRSARAFEATVARIRDKGIRLDGVGFQFHLFSDKALADVLSTKNLTPQKLRTTYDRMATLGVPMYLTEITIPSTLGGLSTGEKLQAEVAENFYRFWFAHTGFAGITWWNLCDGAAWKKEGDVLAGLIGADMRRKPAYDALHDLIRREWTTDVTVTTDGKGCASFRGYFGDYEATLDGKKASFVLTRGAKGIPVSFR